VKISTLIKLGGLTLLLAQLLLMIVDASYYLTGQPTNPTSAIAWVAIFGLIIRTLGIMTAYMVMARTGGVVALIGFVVLVFGEFSSVARMTLSLGVAEGVMMSDQLSQAPSYAAAQVFLPWFFELGQFIFGIAIYLSKTYPKIVGVLIALLGPLAYLTGPLAFTRPIYTILNIIAWVWLGWLLLTSRGISHLEPELVTT
jgi:hypothetical protein